MAAAFPDTITLESATAAWEWADRKLRWAKKASLSYRTAGLFAFPVFSFLILVPLLTELDGRGVEMAGFALDQVPEAAALWEKLHGLVFQFAKTQTQTYLAWAAFLYLLPFAAGLIPGLLVLALYHPKKAMPNGSGDPLDYGKGLVQLLQDAGKKSRDVSLTLYLCAFLLAAIPCGLVFFNFYTPLSGPSRIDMPIDEFYGFPHVYFVGVPLMSLGILALMLVFWVASQPLSWMLRLTCLSLAPKKQLEEAERWVRQCQQEPRKQSDPEPTEMEV